MLIIDSTIYIEQTTWWKIYKSLQSVKLPTHFVEQGFKQTIMAANNGVGKSARKPLTSGGNGGGRGKIGVTLTRRTKT